ncbi:hypothetical protein BDN72DRAFT_855091 [Pluteus cervinus]|uniref:Uncharacterized protein n=1 Tax=Pluteus cervinus TaxID=181527 RepID=A0ACD3B7X9_9AGAR|nr:hypothetical protein BDN72DRAFT_855091 [Pluteus cervinus]
MAAAVEEKPAELTAEAGSAPGPAEDADVTMDGDEQEKAARAVQQIEFYFADSNLPYDKFMWSLYSKDPEHWIPIQTVASFKRMREFTSLGVEWVAKALEQSTELEVDGTRTKVRRLTEVKEPKGQFERSIYAKGFSEETPTLQKELETFFAQYGKTNAVRMRRDEAKKFKGSVFAEFTDIDTVEAFLKAEPKPSWEGKDLLIMTKEAYCEMKIKEKGLTGKAAVKGKDAVARRGFNAFRDNDGKPGKGESSKKEVFLEFMGTKLRIHEDEEGKGTVKEEEVPFVKGATLKFEGCGGDVSWNEIKDPIKAKYERAPFIKYSRGDNHGLVGFHKSLGEEDINFVKEKIPTINSKPVTWTLPEEAEEKAFQIERAQTAAKSALSQNQGSSQRGFRGGRGGGRGGNRGRGGRGGGRGGHRDRRDDKGKGRSDAQTDGGEGTGEKRKRAVEPDGGPDVGVRGTAGPPIIRTASKKAKVDEGDS